jgi:hypothetical protein
MTFWVGGLTLSYLLTACVVVWLLISAKGRIWLKTAIISLLIGYMIIVCMSVPKLKGWPTEEPISEEGIYLMAYKIVEPGTGSDIRPGIYIWGTPKVEARLNLFGFLMLDITTAPRAYVLPYQKQTHEQLVKSQKESQKSGRFLLLRKGKGKSKAGGGKSYEDDQLKYEFIDPRKLLLKDER